MPDSTTPVRAPSPASPDPATPTAAVPAVEPQDPAAVAEAAAWAEVTVRWEEPAAHRAYLDGRAGLEGLAAAGRRYRDVLAARPGDAVALAMKGEVLKRATVVGMAMLPRTSPPAGPTGRWKRIGLLLLASWLGSTLAWLLWKLFSGPSL